ncbi:MAG: glycosyltransferase family 4 protein [Lactobacillaceae bacterium]|jgi:glycosyltransferase involved in cell wall biosynthesis|nr:glycosyltransferase family 4 protein [Lactobacillaceae bacterium]
MATKKQKILVLSPVGGNTNGADVALNHQLEYLSALNYEIFLVVNNFNLGDFQEFLSKNNIKVYQMEYSWWNDDNLNNFDEIIKNKIAVAKLIEIIKQEKIDIAISNTINVPQLAIAAKETNIPNIWLIHEFPDGEFAFTKKVYKFIDQYSSKILAVGPRLADELNKLVKQKVDFFYPYTKTPAIIKNNSNQFSGRIISVNAITGDNKNTFELVKIFAELQKKYPNFQLFISGGIFNRDYFNQIEKYIKLNKIKNITFTNDFENNWKDINENDIFVNTSKMETFSLTLSETIKNGMVTVVSNNRGFLTNKDLKFIDSTDIYKLGNIEDAVKKISHKIDNFAKEKQKAKKHQELFLSQMSLDKLVQPVLKAIKNIKKPADDFHPFINEFAAIKQVYEDKKIFQYKFKEAKELNFQLNEEGKVLKGEIKDRDKHIESLISIIDTMQNRKVVKIADAINKVIKK